MHKQEFAPEYDTHKVFWDFDIQTDLPNHGQKTKRSNS